MKKLFLSLLFPWMGLTASGQVNDPYDRFDAFEYHNLTNIRHSPLFYSLENPYYFDMRDLFGGEFGPVEKNGHVVFSDGFIPPFGIDWVEFETVQWVALDGYRMILVRDFGLPSRETSHFTFKADVDGSGNYKRIDDFAPDYPPLATGLSENERRFSTPLVARRFRVEFQRSVILANGGRLVELDAISTPNGDLPQIVFVSPEPEVSLQEGENLLVSIQVQDNDPIRKISLFANDKLLGSSSNVNTLQITWSNLPAGPQVLRVWAMDSLGAESQISRDLVIAERRPLILLSRPRNGGGYTHFDVQGGVEGRPQVVFSSSDLKQWTAVRTNVHPGHTWTFSEPVAAEKKFYRVEHLLQFEVEEQPDEF